MDPAVVGHLKFDPETHYEIRECARDLRLRMDPENTKRFRLRRVFLELPEILLQCEVQSEELHLAQTF